MNLVLFEPAELAAPLSLSDPRARHVLDVLRRREGDSFDAGLVNGPRGKATVVAVGADSLTMAFAWEPLLAPLPALTLVLGLPRPQTARDILRDATTLGATCIHFVSTERADPNYATSSLWTSGEWRRHCLAGAAQAFDTRIPEITWTHSLSSAAATLTDSSLLIALDNYEAKIGFGPSSLAGHPPFKGSVLALGPERGWGPSDRAVLRTAGFTLAHLGPRVLRLETAVVAVLAIAGATK